MTKGESSPKDHRIPPFIRHFLCVHGDHVRIPGLVGHTKPDGGGKGSTLSFKTGKGNRHGPSARTSAFGRFRPANTARRRSLACRNPRAICAFTAKHGLTQIASSK